MIGLVFHLNHALSIKLMHTIDETVTAIIHNALQISFNSIQFYSFQDTKCSEFWHFELDISVPFCPVPLRSDKLLNPMNGTSCTKLWENCTSLHKKKKWSGKTVERRSKIELMWKGRLTFDFDDGSVWKSLRRNEPFGRGRIEWDFERWDIWNFPLNLWICRKQLQNYVMKDRFNVFK